MRLSTFIILAGLMSSMAPLSASAEQSFDKAISCFNNSDFGCAYWETVDLLKAGRVVIGNGDKTTDSMTFFQMAYVEHASRANVVEQQKMATPIIKDIARQPSRLPFVFGFNLLVLAEGCNGEKECRDGYMKLFCRVQKEIPQPEWRPLNEINAVSGDGMEFFDRIWRDTPGCAGA